jgi:sucrose-6-phosphate hydrolase SacC (GH32 family)
VVLEGWRDPFIYRKGGDGNKWLMVMGSGYERDGRKIGCVMLYSSDSVRGPWTYDGLLASGEEDMTPQLGRVWECPALVHVRLLAQLHVCRLCSLCSAPACWSYPNWNGEWDAPCSQV